MLYKIIVKNRASVKKLDNYKSIGILYIVNSSYD